VIPGNIQDRDSAAGLIERALQKYPRLKKIFADGGYAGPKLASQLVGLPLELEIVKRTDKEGGFKILRRRWVIERTFSWLRRNRRPLRSPRHDRRWLCQAHDDRGHAEAADEGGPLIYRANFRFRL